VLLFLLAQLPNFRHLASAPAAEPGSLTLLLRSEASSSQPLTHLAARASQAIAKQNATPILPSAPRVAAQSAAPSAALALRDKTDAQLRAALSPPTAPRVDSGAGIVLILDISGSMYEPYAGSTRLALARQVLAQRIRDLKEGTPFALAVYGETALRSGPLVPANDLTRAAAIHFLDQDYACGGGTNLPAGLEVASELHMGAILLVTDGDLNMTAAELLPKTRSILGPEGACPALTIIGIGPRANTDAPRLLNELAEQQGGTYQSDEGGALTASLTLRNSDVSTP
jgi:Mg-chelatase subunit ChlD